MIDGLPDPLPVAMRNSAIEHKSIPPGVSTEVLGPSPKRVGLMLSVQTGNSVAFNNRPMSGALDGFFYNSNQSPIILFAEKDGDIVKKPWFCFNSAAGAAEVGWIETIEQ